MTQDSAQQTTSNQETTLVYEVILSIGVTT